MRATVFRTILIALYPEYSGYNGSLTLARQLTERGFKVVYLTDRRFDTYLRTQGFETVTFHGFDDANAKAREFESLGKLKRFTAAMRLRFEVAVEACEFLEAWMLRNPVELVLLDPLVYELAAPVLKLRVRIIGLNTNLAGVRNSCVPPVFSDKRQTSGRGLSCRIAVFFSWLKCDFKRLHAQSVLPLVQMLCIGPLRWWRYSPLRAIKRHGGRLGWGEYGFRVRVPELIMAPREFDYPNAWHWTTHCYLGACVAQDRFEGDSDWGNPRDDRPLIYCSLGTYSGDYSFAARLFRAVVECGSQRPNWRFLVQVGPGISGLESVVPENVRVCKWVPQLEVLRHATVFITHGGLSSVRESIYYRVPMLVFPCRLDQPGNAARVVFHGLGLRGDIESVEPESLLRQLEHLVLEPRFRDAVARFSRVFREQENCSDGANCVQQFLYPSTGPS